MAVTATMAAACSFAVALYPRRLYQLEKIYSRKKKKKKDVRLLLHEIRLVIYL